MILLTAPPSTLWLVCSGQMLAPALEDYTLGDRGCRARWLLNFLAPHPDKRSYRHLAFPGLTGSIPVTDNATYQELGTTDSSTLLRYRGSVSGEATEFHTPHNGTYGPRHRESVL